MATSPAINERDRGGPIEGRNILSRLKSQVVGLPQALLRLDGWTIIVLAAAGFYGVVIGNLDLLKAATYNQTFTTLGIDNRILWLISHGGFAEYSASGFGQIYGFPYGKWLLFVFVPVYSVWPSLTTLILLEVIGTSLSPIPLYLYARRLLRSNAAGALVALTLVIYYPLTSANLTGDLTIAWFPVLFFSMCAALSSRHTKLAYVFAVLTAAVNGLSLFMVLIVLFFGFPIADGTTVRVWAIKRRLRDLTKNYWKLCCIVALIILTAIYQVLGGFHVESNSGPGQTLLQVLLYDVNLKLLFFVTLLAPLAFLPLLDDLTILTMLPFLGFIFYSENAGTYVPFGHQYVLIAAGPLYMGLVRSLAWLKSRSQPQPNARGDNVAEGTRSSFDSDLREFSKPYVRAFAIFIVLSCVFGAVYFPTSPINGSVSGGLFDGSADTATWVTQTAQTTFLTSAIALIPADGSVLTQNNIPQLSGREFYQVGSLMVPGIPYNYVLMDASVAYFSQGDFPNLTAVLNSGIPDGQFGILAEGQGALLAERSYGGSIQLYSPVNETFDATNLDLSTGFANGTTIVNTQAGNSAWYGPYLTLFPGSYLVQFTLKLNSTANANQRILTLEITSNSGSNLLNYSYVTPGQFSAPDRWQTFDLGLTLDQIVTGIELKGVSPAGGLTITLQKILVSQVSAFSPHAK